MSALFLLLFTLTPGQFSDVELDHLLSQIPDVIGDPVQTVLLADAIYLQAHTTSRQADILQAMENLFEKTNDPEAKGEIGYVLTQLLRQSGRWDEIATLVPALGYVTEWQILGPLPPQIQDPISFLELETTSNMGREMRWNLMRAHGEQDYWSSGLGHFGFFDVNAAVYPTQLVSVILTTQFYAEEKGFFRLGLGFNHQAQAWVNKTQIINLQGKHDAHPDQTALKFYAKKGWNQLTLVLQTNEEKTNLGAFVRLTTLNGEPLRFRADRNLASKRKIKKIERLPAIIDLAKGDYARGTMLLIKEWDEHPQLGSPLELLRKELEKNPTENCLEKVLSLTEDYNLRYQHLTDYLDQFPSSAFALTKMGQLALSQNRFWEARRWAGKALEQQPEYWPAQILMNNTVSQVGLSGMALRETEKLHKTYPGVPWIMMDLCDLAWRMEFRQVAEPVLDQILAIRVGHPKFLERKVQLLREKADVEALDDLYLSALSYSPYSIRLRQEYAQFLAANNRFEQADKVLLDALNQTPDNPDLNQAYGELKLRRGDQDAIAFLKKSLKIKPQNPALEQLLALSLEDQTDFFEPYKIKADEIDRTVFTGEVASAVINLKQSIVKVSPNGQASEYHQIEWEILEDQAQKELPGFSFSYAPLRQNAELLKAEILRGEETILIQNTGRVRLSEPEYRTYYDLVAYQVAFPQLRVGDRVRVSYRIDETQSQNIFGDYFGDLIYFAEQFPIRTQTYTLIFPEGRELFHHVEKMDAKLVTSQAEGAKVLTWTKKGLTSAERESRMPGLHAFLPYISVSTFRNWDHMGRWYANLIDGQLELDLATKKLTQSLVEGVEDPLEKLKRIHEFVVTHTRYVALEFGIHGYKPYQVNQVCSRQFGDCKDKASLLIAMLREVGLEAEMVIVRTSDKGDIHSYPASLAYFNHAIAYVPKFDLYLDGTAEFSGIYELPEMDQGALCLRVAKDGESQLTHIPVRGENTQNYTVSMKVKANGEASLNGVASFKGTHVPPLRQLLSLEGKVEAITQNMLLNKFPGLSVSRANRVGQAFNDPISLEFEGTTRQLLVPSNSGYRLPLKALGDPLVPLFAPNSFRKFPLQIGVPNSKKIEYAIEVPHNFLVSRLPEPVELENEYLRFQFKIGQNEHELNLEYNFEFKKELVPPEAYQELRQGLLAHDEILDRAIEFTREDS